MSRNVPSGKDVIFEIALAPEENEQSLSEIRGLFLSPFTGISAKRCRPVVDGG
jgi:hypothetical protein